MVAIKEKDFVELDYTGRLHGTGDVFDTTDEKVAKDNELHDQSATYKPVIICVGRGHLIRGIDEQLVGKEVGKSYTFAVEPEKAFGKKNPKLLKLMSAAQFRKQEIAPQLGLQVSVDGRLGTVRSVTGGRIVVDFNHPLAGRALDYEVKVLRKVSSKEEQGKALMKFLFGQEPVSVEAKEKKLVVTLPTEVPAQLKDLLSKEFKELVGVVPEFAVGEAAKQSKPSKA